MRDGRHGAARLLVVDDNKVNRLLLARNLALQGHSAALAENGRVALEMLRRERFDLLLLDMEMPEMDGFQVLEQLVGDLQLRDIPVIVTSSLEGIDNVVRCIELGAEDYLTKPQIRIGIGIASGEMVAGYTGTNDRATYTCIGNTVNLAARLEAHTKVALRTILIDSGTRAGLSADVRSEALGTIALKGLAAPVDVFAVGPGQRG